MECIPVYLISQLADVSLPVVFYGDELYCISRTNHKQRPNGIKLLCRVTLDHLIHLGGESAQPGVKAAKRQKDRYLNVKNKLCLPFGCNAERQNVV